MSELSNQLEKLSYQAQELSNQANNLASNLVESSNGHGDFLVFGFTQLRFCSTFRFRFRFGAFGPLDL